MRDVVTISMLTYATPSRIAPDRAWRLTTMIVMTHPAWATIAVHAMWLSTWLDLDRRIGAVPDYLFVIAILGWPIFAIPMMSLAVLMADTIPWRWWKVLSIMLAGHLVAFVLMRLDPSHVWSWFWSD